MPVESVEYVATAGILALIATSVLLRETRLRVRTANRCIMQRTRLVQGVECPAS
jgi:hypothetical protein